MYPLQKLFYFQGINLALASKMLKSFVWLYLGRCLRKFSGLLSTVFLARILTPDDFGIVATAAIVVSIFTTLTSVGPQTYLLRKESISDDDLNTAWSIGIALRLIVFTCVYISAPFAANFFSDERLIGVLRAISIYPLIGSFKNIGMLLYQKNMNYKPGFQLGMIVELTALVSKISFALLLGNYWAFIAAELFSKLVAVIGSYYFHSFRPSLSFKNIKEQWAFSQWVLAKGIFSSIRFKIDNILISKFFPSQALGLYSISKDLATMPAGQVVGPLMQPLYVGFSESIKSPKVLADKAHKAILAAGMIVFPIAFGISALAEPIVFVLLGKKWLEAIPLVEVITFILLSGVFTVIATQLFNVMGKVKASFYIDVFLGIFTISIFVMLGKELSLSDFALLRVCLGLFSVFCMYFFMRMVSNISVVRILLLVFPVLFMAGSMYLFVKYIDSIMLSFVPILRLLLGCIAGVVFYGFCTLFAVSILKKISKEYEFIWKTFYLPIFKIINRKRFIS